MDKRIIKAYANIQAGFYAREELEEYICEELGVPNGYLNDKYREIAEEINSLYGPFKDDYPFKVLIHKKYMELIDELERERKEK